MESLQVFKENPQTMDSEKVLKKLLQLQQLKKEITALEKVYTDEISLRTNNEDVDIGVYKVQYKSSNLFDKEKAKKYIFDNDMQNDFIVQDLDYKKVQHFIKGVADYNDFVKKSSPRLVIDRK